MRKPEDIAGAAHRLGNGVAAAAKSASPRRHWLPGLGSYRGRYLYLSILFSLGLALTAGFGYWQVRDVEQRQLLRFQVRSQTAGVLHESQQLMSETEGMLYRFLLTPSEIAQRRLSLAANRLLSGLEVLRGTLDETNAGAPLTPVNQIVEEGRRLRWAISELLALRQDTRLWLPAATRMEQMQAASRHGIGAASALVERLRTTRDEPELAALTDDALAMRHLWLSATAETRLLIINRFNVFETGGRASLRNRSANIRQFLETADVHLERLQAARATGVLDLETEDLVGNIATAFANWKNLFTIFHSEIVRDDWRRDLGHLSKEIYPILTDLQQRLSSLRLELEVQSARDITEVTKIAGDLSTIMLWVVLIGVIAGVLGYVAFIRLLLTPIRNTALALRQEATGQKLTVSISSPVEETHDLVDAFEELQQQVRMREARLDYMAHHDALTDLPNRSLFNDRLDHAAELSKRDDSPLGIMFLDLDRFKQINDSLGHQIGDEILIETASRLSQQVRASDTVARLGGDEFAILMERVRRPEELEIVAEKVLREVRKPYRIGEHELHISTSIGIAVCPTDGTDPEELLRHADTAMYEAKRRGKSRYHFFSAELGSLASRQVIVEAALRRALANREFLIHLQPVTSPDAGSPYAFEALLRWHHPERGLVAPGDFLDVLVDSGLIVPVTEWIFDEVDRLGRILTQRDRPKISVNLSANLLQNSAFSDRLIRRLQRNHPPPEHLILEITEDSLGEHIGEASSILRQLRELGVRIALDDFGTGQSSLGHLRRFPFDILKIDREFVRDVQTDENDANLVTAIIRMGRALNMVVVAEGVETREQLEFVRNEGCQYVQGYLIGKPEPAHNWFGPTEVSAST